jgi:hypothetical protein
LFELVGEMTMKQQSQHYGTPIHGSLTESRGKVAHHTISNDIICMCEVIERNGKKSQQNPLGEISFGQLFDLYTNINNKVVGILLRGRKHGFFDFPGEILFQRNDDRVMISLNISSIQLRQKQREFYECQEPSNFKWGECI